MSVEKNVFKLWKEISPLSAFLAGLKGFEGKVWVPTRKNERTALRKINALLRITYDPVAVKFLKSMRFGFLHEEPHDIPGSVLSYFYNYILVEGFNERHLDSIASGCIETMNVKEYLLKKNWPAEVKILSVLSCDGTAGVLKLVLKKAISRQLKQKIRLLLSENAKWRKKLAIGRIRKGDFEEIYPLLKKYSKDIGRKKYYRRLLKDIYDYTETPKQIERKALSWIRTEYPLLKAHIAKLAKKSMCRAELEAVEKAVKKQFNVKPQQLLSTIARMRRLLKPIAERQFVSICPEYRVRVIQTPAYLVPFIPTAAMNTFKHLTKKLYCVFFATTDSRGSPSDNLADICQTIIHEEYGHCVNFMNSYTGFQGKRPLLEILGSSLDIPITEGISFHRELEALDYFRQLSRNKKRSAEERAFVAAIEKFASFADFVDAFQLTVLQWRFARFFRALSDSRVNSGKQSYIKFLEWAHKTTGLRKKFIYSQTFFFQEHPGYAPAYSIFGQKLRQLQSKALKKGVSRLAFNTFVASAGFPARTVLEERIRKKFRIF